MPSDSVRSGHAGSSARIRGATLGGALALLLAAGGCARPVEAPPYLTIDAGGYGKAFDAALEASRQAGLAPVVRDRRAGVIVTDPRLVASILEPWRAADQTFDTTSAGTTSMDRVRARFEFVPVGFAPSMAGRDDQLVGPDVVGIASAATDLSALEGPLEMRVWVYVERAHHPGVRRSTWSRRLTTRYEIVEEGEPLPRTFWVTEARNETAERRLMQRVLTLLAEPAGPPDAEDAIPPDPQGDGPIDPPAAAG